MPGRWVIRRDVDGYPEGEALRCFVEGAIVAEPGFRTVEQCVASLLRDGEICGDTDEKRPILRGGSFVGYIEISKQLPLT